MSNRYDRNERFFGKEGQAKLNSQKIALVGCGGNGTHVAQQLSHLGMKEIVIIDDEEIDHTNLNRYVGSRYTDPTDSPIKVDIVERTIKLINPAIKVAKVKNNLLSYEAVNAIKQSDCVFGCLDNEGARFVLNEICSAFDIPYIDIATDILTDSDLIYGGRVFVNWNGTGCLHCMSILDLEDVQNDLGDDNYRKQKNKIYGIEETLLDKKGPSVVSINGVVSSYAVVEYICAITKIRKPHMLATYRAHEGKMVVSTDVASGDCYYCNKLRSQGERVNINRYIKKNQ
jgi:molybdopterin/thiamine biosynthesis adenylyltransferase